VLSRDLSNFHLDRRARFFARALNRGASVLNLLDVPMHAGIAVRRATNRPLSRQMGRGRNRLLLAAVGS
jgi:hypothetical protein